MSRILQQTYTHVIRSLTFLLPPFGKLLPFLFVNHLLCALDTQFFVYFKNVCNTTFHTPSWFPCSFIITFLFDMRNNCHTLESLHLMISHEYTSFHSNFRNTVSKPRFQQIIGIPMYEKRSILCIHQLTLNPVESINSLNVK